MRFNDFKKHFGKHQICRNIRRNKIFIVVFEYDN
jgi:hypothetical protein